MCHLYIFYTFVSDFIMTPIKFIFLNAFFFHFAYYAVPFISNYFLTFNLNRGGVSVRITTGNKDEIYFICRKFWRDKLFHAHFSKQKFFTYALKTFAREIHYKHYFFFQILMQTVYKNSNLRQL